MGQKEVECYSSVGAGLPANSSGPSIRGQALSYKTPVKFIYAMPSSPVEVA